MSDDYEPNRTATDPLTETVVSDGDDDEQQFDMDAINDDIAAGAKALSHLLTHAADDWHRWSITIRGLRGLRDLALAKAHTRDIKSWHYRQQLGALLRLRKHSIYDRIDKQTRSSCYKLLDRLDEIDHWYIALPASDQMRWKHPDSIAKHCPKHLLAGGQHGHNQPKKTGKKKPASTANEEWLRALLIIVIQEFVMPANPQRARELLKQVYPPDDFNDHLDDV